MNKKYLIVLIILSVFCVACNNKEASLFEKGQTALENHDYSKAQEYLSDVLEADSKNESARSMYMQASKMYKAEYYKQNGLYDKSIKNLESIVNIENGSNKIKIESEELKKEVENLKEKEEESSNIRKENAKQVAKKAVEESEKNFYIWQKNQQNNLEQENQNNKDDSSNSDIIDSIKNALDGLLNF